MPDAPSQLAAAQAPPLVQPQRDVVPIAQAQRGREGEWEMWFSHRFTKVKRNKLWTGWQCVCVCVRKAHGPSGRPICKMQPFAYIQRCHRP